MRRVKPPAGDENGVVVLVVAAAMVAMLGITALVIDVGALLDERRQLQNGADAAALAVAKSCALGACDTSAAASMANANASDKAAEVVSVTYPAANQVMVRTRTRASDGGTILPYAFGQAVAGQRGGTVHASATAQWTGVGQATVIPLTISMCEFNAATSNGTVFNTTFTGPPRVIYFHTGGQSALPCSSPSGADLPGGFGWLTSTNCEITVNAGTSVKEDADTGNSAPCSIRSKVGTTVLVPIFGEVNGLGGTNGQYTISGFAELRLTGYRFPADSAGTPVPCSPPRTCIGGYFTRLVTIGEIGGGPNFGASVVSLVN